VTTDLDDRALDRTEDRADSSRRRRPSLVLPILLTAGLLVYELTARPELGAAVACTKFGWEDFLTARWLRHRDPDRRRGRASFWLFVAAGLWKTAVTAVVVIFAVAFLESHFRPPPVNQPLPPSACIAGAMFMAAAGFCCCTVATTYAFVLAVRHHVRLWIDRRVHGDRRAERWPPASGTSRRNRAGAVLFTALFLGMLGLLVVVNMTLHGVVAWAGLQPGTRDIVDMVVNLVCGELFLLFPVVMLICRDILANLALARTPAECWEAGSECSVATSTANDRA
jgi:hypothetical protein